MFYRLSFLLILCTCFWNCQVSKNAISGEVPDLILQTYNGESVSLKSKESRVSLIVFWATWCGPCQMEIPSLIKLHEKFKAQNFSVLAINVDDPEGAKVKAIAQEMGINYPLLIGSEELTKQFGGIEGLPTSFLVGKDQKFKAKIVGLHPEEELEEKILSALHDSI